MGKIKLHSFSQMEDVMMKASINALESCRQEVKDNLQSGIDDFYSEYKPIRYVRSHEFEKNSVGEPQVFETGFEPTVYLTEGLTGDYLKHIYEPQPVFKHFGGFEITGAEQAELANMGFHGDIYIGKSHFWDTFLDYMARDFKESYYDALKRHIKNPIHEYDLEF